MYSCEIELILVQKMTYIDKRYKQVITRTWSSWTSKKRTLFPLMLSLLLFLASFFYCYFISSLTNASKDQARKSWGTFIFLSTAWPCLVWQDFFWPRILLSGDLHCYLDSNGGGGLIQFFTTFTIKNTIKGFIHFTMSNA